MVLSFTTVAATGQDVGQIVSDIPRDGPAMFIYVITAVSLWLIWQGSRTRDPGPSRAVAHDSGETGADSARPHESALAGPAERQGL